MQSQEAEGLGSIERVRSHTMRVDASRTSPQLFLCHICGYTHSVDGSMRHSRIAQGATRSEERMREAKASAGCRSRELEGRARRVEGPELATGPVAGRSPRDGLVALSPGSQHPVNTGKTRARASSDKQSRAKKRQPPAEAHQRAPRGTRMQLGGEAHKPRCVTVATWEEPDRSHRMRRLHSVQLAHEGRTRQVFVRKIKEEEEDRCETIEEGADARPNGTWRRGRGTPWLQPRGGGAVCYSLMRRQRRARPTHDTCTASSSWTAAKT